MTRCCRALLATIGLLVVALPGMAGVSSLAQDVVALKKIDHDNADVVDKIPPMKQQYDRILAKSERRTFPNLSNEDLKQFFDASEILAFYTFQPEYVREMRRAFGELERRHLLTLPLRQKMLDAYVGARMLDEARAFATAYEDENLGKLPTFEDGSSPDHSTTLWRVSADGATLTRHDFSYSGSAEVIVVSAPGCEFTREASAAIAKDPELSTLIAEHSTWVIPQNLGHDFGDVAGWNRAHPGWPMQLVHQQAEWPFIARWATPSFYFLEDGKVVASVIGWPGPERLGELRAGFEKIGIR